MKPLHLLSGVLAITLLAVSVAGGALYASATENSLVHSLATATFQQKNQGSALQVQAIRQPDLLLLYGSSEVGGGGPYNPSELFRHYPTGFTVFPVARGGLSSLLYLQDLASLGLAAKGKKVVISYTPSSFLVPMASQEFVAGNFSRLHALSLVFSSELSPALKQAVAKRMLQYPSTYAHDPLLASALQSLAEGSPGSRADYFSLLPLAQLNSLVASLQDDWETLAYIAGRQGHFNPVTHSQGALDWTALAQKAEKEQALMSASNTLGFDDNNWFKYERETSRLHNSLTDAQFLSRMEQSAEWGDLDLLLRAARELGMDVAVICTPLNGAYYDYIGVSRGAREAFYRKLTQATGRHGVPVVTFSDHDGDTLFLVDQYSHPSRKGMVYYDQALDAFYHGQLH